MPYKKISGIYCIFNNITKKRYIGSSYSVRSRISTHKNQLLKGKHFNTHLQASFFKYGINAFEFEILEKCDVSELINRENYWIKHLKSNNRLFGYNVRLDSMSNTGIKLTPITREKLRISHLGHKRSKEANEKIRKSQFKSVIQIDSNGKKLNEFESMLDAEKQTGICKQAISGVCRKINKSAGGYYWCFSEKFYCFIIPKDLRKKI